MSKPHEYKEEEPISDLKEGDYIKITYLPYCRNVYYNVPNPYIGMEGTVKFVDHESFDLFTGTAWLIGLDIKTCKYEQKTKVCQTSSGAGHKDDR